MPRLPPLSEGQRELLAQLPGWAKENRCAKMRLRAALKICNVGTMAQLRALTEEHIETCIQNCSHKRKVMTRFILRNVLSRMGCGDIGGHANPQQQAQSEALSGQSLSDQERAIALAGLVVLQIDKLEGLQRLSTNTMLERISEQDDMDAAVRAVSLLRKLAGHGVPLTRRMVQSWKRYNEPYLAVAEVEWLEQNPNEESHYLAFRVAFQKHLSGACGLPDKGPHSQLWWQIVHACEIATTLAVPRGWQNLHEVKVDEAMEVTAGLVMRGLGRKNSLLGQRRQTRRTDAGKWEPGRDLCRTFGTACLRLLRFWAVPTWDHAKTVTLWRMVSQRLPVSVQDLPHTRDAVTLDEMKRLEESARTPRERLIIILMCRLGMRIGAVRHLRIAGVVEDFTELPRDGAAWTIRRLIQGSDKGNRVNQWDTMFEPLVNRELESYVNEHWRPSYEDWIEDGGQRRLFNGYLFPGRDAGAKMSSHSFQKLAKKVFVRAGISGSRAHPHAIRKGVVTALLQAGNPLTSVAKFVHHSNSSVTENSYDKRTYEQVVEKMVLPLEWEKEQPGSEDIDDMAGALDDAPASVGTGDTTRAAMALLEEMGKNEVLQQELNMAKSLFTADQMQRWLALTNQSL